MSGSPETGRKARDKLLEKDPDYYRKLGRLGGKGGKGMLKGFAANHDSAVTAGKKGGTISRRNKHVATNK
jgi:general stress protein YciG